MASRRWSFTGEFFSSRWLVSDFASYEMQVAADARRIGLGRRLLQDCEALAKGTGMRKTMLTCLKSNEQGLLFYHRNGYVCHLLPGIR
jgi:GNAT superfamily N-acetyltransferase